MTVLILSTVSWALLKHKGFSTVACHGGEEALAVFGTSVPDHIRLRIMMEPMDG